MNHWHRHQLLRYFDRANASVISAKSLSTSDPALPNSGLEEGGRGHTGLCGHRVTPLPVEKIPVGSASLLSSSADHGLSSLLTSSHPGAWSPVAREEGEEKCSARVLESWLWYLLAGWL